MKVILASQSPRRKELLGWLVDAFTVVPADICEAVQENELPEAYVQRMANEKAMHVWQQHPESLVIASDTIVVHHSKIYGKPRSKDEAYRMLRSYSGQTHQVLTAVTLKSAKQTKSCLVTTEVTFFPLADTDIERYLATEDYLDKAGAYGIQGQAARMIEKINGDYYSVMGFPVGPVSRMLASFDSE